MEWYRRVLDAQENSLGKDHPDTLVTVCSMANSLRRQGKYDEALEFFRRALAGQEKSLGNGHPDTLATSQHIEEVLRELRLE